MKVLRAKSAGFCWGVERAINLARDETKAGRKAYADGPLIHNNQMMDALRKEGIREVGDYKSQSDIEVSEKDAEDGVVVVRAHGISPQRRQYLKSLDMSFKDATCPDVGIIAGKVRWHAQKGYDVVIFGDPDHPEAIGLLGYAGERGHVVQTKEDIDALPSFEGKVAMVSQSTMFSHEFEELAVYLSSKYPDLVVFDTVCGATKERQSDLQWLVDEGAEAVVVIGGRHSANTKKLAKLATTKNRPTFHVETAEELDLDAIQNYDVVGVTAGASTPDFIIDSVCEKLEKL
ncbi:MAG: 4-hydroxy-3-methylbut-2-enyl diphosphate reductase [Opitutae bacterium]|nr:4-hydroxy-3-methylbut-2-enyl diphosphate reductase [Opitutae bacterium]|tara:strand:+ start:4912 stop:5778 length:867 start_codon:yes stop_codon:yes gene_type:complete